MSQPELQTMLERQTDTSNNITYISTEIQLQKGIPQKSDVRVYNMAFMTKLVSVSAIGGFLFGYDTGVISGAQLYFYLDFPLITPTQRSLIVSLALAGAAVGSLFSGTASDKVGRKKLIMFADLLFTIGAFTMAFSPSIAVLMAGRVLVGLGVGVAAQIVPLYLSETAPVEIRGKVIAINTATITGGQLFSVILVFLIRPNWRLMLGLSAVPSVLQLIGMIFLPESPRWLGKVGQEDKARGVMHLIYKPEFLDSACEQLNKEVSQLQVETSLGEKERLQSLFTTYIRCLVIGCGVQAWQQLVGINTAMYYGPDILIQAGLKIPGMDPDESALLLNIPLAGVNAIGTLISCVYIDKLGRRFLMLRTLPISSIGWLITAFGMYLNGYTSQTTVGSYVAFTGIILFLASFSIGMSSTPWTVNTEIYPLHVIGTANSLSTTTNWATNFVVATVFLIFLDTKLGSVLSFVFLAGMAMCAWVFIYYLLPETAGRNIDEILYSILGSVDKQGDKIKTTDSQNQDTVTAGEMIY